MTIHNILETLCVYKHSVSELYKHSVSELLTTLHAGWTACWTGKYQDL